MAGTVAVADTVVVAGAAGSGMMYFVAAGTAAAAAAVDFGCFVFWLIDSLNYYLPCDCER